MKKVPARKELPVISFGLLLPEFYRPSKTTRAYLEEKKIPRTDLRVAGREVEDALEQHGKSTVQIDIEATVYPDYGLSIGRESEKSEKIWVIKKVRVPGTPPQRGRRGNSS